MELIRLRRQRTRLVYEVFPEEQISPFHSLRFSIFSYLISDCKYDFSTTINMHIAQCIPFAIGNAAGLLLLQPKVHTFNMQFHIVICIC